MNPPINAASTKKEIPENEEDEEEFEEYKEFEIYIESDVNPIDDVSIDSIPESLEESTILSESERTYMEKSILQDSNESEVLFRLNKDMTKNDLDKKEKVERVKQMMMVEKLFDQLLTIYQDGISAISDISDQFASGFIGATSSVIYITTFITLFSIWTFLAISILIVYTIGYFVSKCI